MRKWILIIVFIIIGIIAYNYIYQKHRNISEEQPEFVLKADELKSEFLSNSPDSEQKYLNKIMEITGSLSEYNPEQLTLDQMVFCQMKDPLNLTLQKDMVLTIKGRFIGYDDLLEQVKLDQCTIIN